eukprot:TRINITY_DN2732_c1_g1_i1.p1 TRINITY_DN2732_c1_g1~~TRINITY_DN2732_c1_g1_i1.p1  ORF type:complete len:756 (+),score=125.28 TRINITY_DN2732_c1_g1_i1:144-2411(+)
MWGVRTTTSPPVWSVRTKGILRRLIRRHHVNIPRWSSSSSPSSPSAALAEEKQRHACPPSTHANVEFARLRRENMLYVDKTELISSLVSPLSKHRILRPEGFGKTLLVSTLESLFSGEKQSFTNTWLSSKVAEYRDGGKRGARAEAVSLLGGWSKPCVVIRLNFDEIASSLDRNHDGGSEPPNVSATPASSFESAVILALQSVGREVKVDVETSGSASAALFSLIDRVTSSTGQHVVLLVDGYDTPLWPRYIRPPAAAATTAGWSREVEVSSRSDIIASLLEVTSELEHMVKYQLLTGTYPLGNDRLLSHLGRHVRDVTLDMRFSWLLGYTHDEVVTSFGPHLEMIRRSGVNASNGNESGHDDLVRRLANTCTGGYWWNGHNLDGKFERTLHPLLVNRCMSEWMRVGRVTDSGRATDLAVAWPGERDVEGSVDEDAFALSLTPQDAVHIGDAMATYHDERRYRAPLQITTSSSSSVDTAHRTFNVASDPALVLVHSGHLAYNTTVLQVDEFYTSSAYRLRPPNDMALGRVRRLLQGSSSGALLNNPKLSASFARLVCGTATAPSSLSDSVADLGACLARELFEQNAALLCSTSPASGGVHALPAVREIPSKIPFARRYIEDITHIAPNLRSWKGLLVLWLEMAAADQAEGSGDGGRAHVSCLDVAVRYDAADGKSVDDIVECVRVSLQGDLGDVSDDNRRIVDIYLVEDGAEENHRVAMAAAILKLRGSGGAPTHTLVFTVDPSTGESKCQALVS